MVLYALTKASAGIFFFFAQRYVLGASKSRLFYWLILGYMVKSVVHRPACFIFLCNQVAVSSVGASFSYHMQATSSALALLGYCKG